MLHSVSPRPTETAAVVESDKGACAPTIRAPTIAPHPTTANNTSAVAPCAAASACKRRRFDHFAALNVKPEKVPYPLLTTIAITHPPVFCVYSKRYPYCLCFQTPSGSAEFPTVGKQ